MTRMTTMTLVAVASLLLLAATQAQTVVKDLKCPASSNSTTAGGYRPTNLTQTQVKMVNAVGRRCTDADPAAVHYKQLFPLQ